MNRSVNGVMRMQRDGIPNMATIDPRKPILKNDSGDKSEVDKPDVNKKDNTTNRVNPRKGTKAKVKEKINKDENGQMLDPNTGQVMDENSMDLGHIPGQEWSKRKKEHQEKGSTRKEVIEAENNPDLYQYEDRSSNRSHKYEQKPPKKKQ
jgi:hypothetical protein